MCCTAVNVLSKNVKQTFWHAACALPYYSRSRMACEYRCQGCTNLVHSANNRRNKREGEQLINKQSADSPKSIANLRKIGRMDYEWLNVVWHE